MDSIAKGSLIEVTDAVGRTFVKRATSDVQRDGVFPVVWACSEVEWDQAALDGVDPEPEPFPWPLRSIKALATG